ncbi:uncharacterized protein EV420DRAFT_1277340, partial [Desarmillaria tabescens]
DLYSYNMGQEGANVVTVIVKPKNIDLQGAADFLGGYCRALLDQFESRRNASRRRLFLCCSPSRSFR